MNRRSYVGLAGSLLTTGCLGTVSSSSSTTTEQSESEGYTGFSGGIYDENADTSSNPPTIPQGEPITVKLTVSSEEGTTTSYTVAIQLQQYKDTESDGERSLKLVNRPPLTRSTLTVEDGERKSVSPEVTITESGKNYRLMFLLYKSDAPDILSEKTAYNSFVTPINITSAE